MSYFKERYSAKIESLGGLKGVKSGTAPKPLQPRDLAEIEARLGVVLPEDYGHFLKEIGASKFDGYIYARAIQNRDDFGDQVHFCSFFGSSRANDNGLLYNIKNYEGRIPANMIPIGDNGFGDMFCIGIKGDEVGKVYFWDHEFECSPEDYDDPSQVPEGLLFKNVTLVADSFGDFFDRLEIEEEQPALPTLKDVTPLLDNEWRHLDEGPGSDENPTGRVGYPVCCGGNAAQVLKRIIDVIKIVNKAGRENWPADDDWPQFLPKWFVSRCAEAQEQAIVDPWSVWSPEDDEGREQEQIIWSISNWISWMRPDKRKWFWWEASLVDKDKVIIRFETYEWPFPLGPFDWLARAAGADRVME